MKEVLYEVEKATGRTLNRRSSPRRAGDPPALVADRYRTQHALGWRSRRLLNEIVDSAWRWMRNCNENQRQAMVAGDSRNQER